MATYDSLSAQDKAVVQSTVQLIRAMSGSFARAFNAQQAIAADTNAIALISSIDAGETIPNESGLAGSDDMTRAELVALWQEIVTMQGTHDTPANRAAWAKATGVPNMLGTG